MLPGVWLRRSVQSDGINANVALCVCIDLGAGQQAFPFGTEQALRRAQDSFGEAGVALHVHGSGSLMASAVCRLVVTNIAKTEAVGCAIYHIA